MCAQEKESSEMTGHEARKDMKRKEERKCVKRGNDEKGNQWRGREPMKPDLITTT